ncbi:MAG: hypothetical protein HYR85_05830 [Planctomycetes bacterium]|nr:hypothetical protein [Planctomycetota bacterium]
MTRRIVSFAHVVVLIVVSLLGSREAAGGGASFAGCGALEQAVECVMFRADAGGLYNLDTRGAFIVGDRVFVTGTVDSGCVTFCQQGNGCIRGNTIDRCDCLAGNVNAASGSATDVLLVNSSAGAPGTRVVTAAIGESIQIVMNASPGGPASARYVFYAWLGPASNSTELRARGQRIGCTGNPTPLTPALAPQPYRCLRGGLPAPVCAGVTEVAGAPNRAPFTLLQNRGFGRPITFSFQAILEDAGSANSTGYSVTNEVTLLVQ